MTDIEGSAVGHLLTIFGRTSRLSAEISIGDRTPFTDGHIDVYTSRVKARQHWFARVQVQVKGREKKRRQAKKPTYQVELIDLRMYERSGGVLYFVVDLADQPPFETAYYAILSPKVIDGYLSKLPDDQKSVSIKLTKLPVVPQSLENLMDIASRHVGTNATNAVSLSELKVIESGTLYTVDEVDLSRPITLRSDEVDFAFDVTTPDGVFPSRVSALRIVPESYVEHPFGHAVSAGDVVYEKPTIQRIDDVSAKVTLSETLSITLAAHEARRDFTLNFTHQPNFVERFRDLSFIVRALSTGVVTIGTKELQLGDAPPGATEQLADYRDQLSILRDLDELFAFLGVNGSLISLDDVTEQQMRDLHELHRVFVRGEQPSVPVKQTSRVMIGVGKWLLLIVVAYDKVHGHAERFIDPFSDAVEASGRWRTSDEEGKYYPVTAYEIFDRHELPRVLNLRLDQLVAAHEALLTAPQTIGRANACALALIFAADECPERGDEFLTAADSLTDWLIEKQGSHPSYQVNKWQIAARRGVLTPDDLSAIRALKHEANSDDTTLVSETRVACAVLLEEMDDAQFLVGKLTEAELDRIKTWPIWHLFQRLVAGAE